MAEPTPSNPQTRSKPVRKPGRGRPSLYRTVLSLGIAAIVAAWLPFSVFYVSALNKRATTVTAVSAPHSTAGATRLVTTASGATRPVSVSGSASATPTRVAPVTTHAS
jgi:cytoskeletal protein RodZ